MQTVYRGNIKWIFLFILLYFRLSEHPGMFINLILPYSLLVGGLSGILYFTPIEIMRASKTKVDHRNKKMYK